MCDENQFKQWPKTEKQLQKNPAVHSAERNGTTAAPGAATGAAHTKKTMNCNDNYCSCCSHLFSVDCTRAIIIGSSRARIVD